MAAFEELGVMPEIIKACNSLNWLLPKPVQAEAIPLILGGGDVCISAETGSGKTGAFALPLIQIVFEEKYTKTTSNESRSVKDFDNVIISGAASDPTLKIDPSGLHVQSDRPSWVGGKAGIGVRNGRYYYEAKVEGTGIARIGWATAAASLDLGTDRQGFGFGGTGKYAFGREFNNYGEPFGDGDVIGCYLNAEEGELFFSKNGKTFPPQMLPPNLKGQLLFPAFCIKACSLSFCFGDDEGAEDEATSSAPRNVGEDAEEADSNANSLFQFKPAPTTKGDPFLPIASCPASSSSLFISGASTASTDSSSACSPLIFVLEPVRELAEQTMTVMKQLSSYLPAPGLKVAMLTGGVPAREALDAVASHPDILISTPGKALELVNSGQISFGSIKEFVIDEADRILGDAKDTTGYTLFNAAKKSSCLGQPMQTILVSATLHTEEMKKAIETMLSFPTWADLKGSKSVPECVHHVLVRIDPNEHFKQPPFTPIQTDGIFDIDRSTSKEAVMSQAIKVRKAYVLKDVLDTVKPEQALIFCRTKLDCDNLEQFFNQFQKSKVVENNYSCAVLHADRSPQERRENLDSFKKGEVKYLICTDVAARGIDVQQLPCCINYTLPDVVENYIHRTGRVGRQDRWGLAISLVATEKEKVWYHGCPSRGKKCKDTRLVSEGGCNIWYDEPSLLTAITERLDGTPIVPLAEHLKKRGKVVYGSDRAMRSGMSHSSAIASSVNYLKELEKDVQKSYISFLMEYDS